MTKHSLYIKCNTFYWQAATFTESNQNFPSELVIFYCIRRDCISMSSVYQLNCKQSIKNLKRFQYFIFDLTVLFIQLFQLLGQYRQFYNINYSHISAKTYNLLMYEYLNSIANRCNWAFKFEKSFRLWTVCLNIKNYILKESNDMYYI